MQTKTYMGQTYQQDPRTGEWVRVGPAAQAPASTAPQVVMQAPPPPPPAPPARTVAGATTEGLKPGFMWVDPNNPAAGQIKIPTAPTPDSATAQERLAQIRASLSAVQQARRLSGEALAVGSWSEFLAGTPGVNQARRNMETVLENASASLIQDKIKELAEANQGGVSGMANTATEAQRMAASIANLNANSDRPTLLEQLDRAEEYYLRQAAMLQGKPAPDQETLKAMLPKERQQELAARQPDQMALSTDGTKAIPIPVQYQDAVNRYMAENGGNLDPSQYAAFRLDLDRQYDLQGRTMQSYVEEGQNLANVVAGGGRIGAMPATMSVPTTPMENLVSNIAANPAGAAFMSFADSLTAGIPTRLVGRREEMEAVRQNQPLASFAGDVGGGIAGTLALGGGAAQLGARGLMANPMVQNALFSTASGAAQSEDPLMGAAIGLAGSLGGDVLGRQIGKAFPDTFARRSMQEARESVPTSGELGNRADELYRRAGAEGQMIEPAQTNKFIDDVEQFAAAQGFVTPRGEILGTGPTQDALKLLREFRDQPLTPQNAQTIRDKFAEGRMAMREGAPDPQARMFSGEITSRFDDFAEAADALPGIAAARQVAQRRIMGREIDRATQMGQARGEINYTQGSEDLGIRRAFGALDTGDIRGSRMYTPEVSDAIRTVSRGTPGRNIAQWLGRFSPQGGTGMFGSAGLGTMAGLGASDPLTGLVVGGTMAATGLFGRKLANQMTRNDAELASLIARGGPQFQAMLKQAQEEAAIRAGRIGSGALGATAITPFRD